MSEVIPDMSIPCPYCKGEAKLMDSAAIYRGVSYGLGYICLPCQAYVGVHKGTYDAKGTPANPACRKARMAAHAQFDVIWQHPAMKHTRSLCYQWLAKRLGLTEDECHIGMFSEEEAWFVARELRRITLRVAIREVNRMRGWYDASRDLEIKPFKPRKRKKKR